MSLHMEQPVTRLPNVRLVGGNDQIFLLACIAEVAHAAFQQRVVADRDYFGVRVAVAGRAVAQLEGA